MLAATQDRLEQEGERICEEALPAAEAMVGAGMRPPAWLGAMLEATWSRRLAQILEELDGVTDPARYVSAMDLVAQARHLGLRLDLTAAATWFDRMLTQRLDAIAEGSDASAWQEFLELLQVAARLTVPLPERALQDRMCEILQTRVAQLLETLSDPRDPTYTLVNAIVSVASKLNLNTDAPRVRLRPLEERFAGDPSYWP